MSSIFDTSFLEALKRVTERSATQTKKQPANGASFSSVLADLEKKAAAKEVPQKAEKIEPPLSNLNPEEMPQRAVIKKHHHPDPTAQRFMRTEIQQRQAQEKPFVAPSPVIAVEPVKNQKPEPPVIKSVKRVEAPAAPQIFSVGRYDPEDLTEIVKTAGRYHGVDPGLSLAVAHAESSLRPDAVSSDGHRSKGLFQLLDSTAKDLVGRFEVKESYDPFDPGMNAYLGVGYLRRLHDIFSTSTDLAPNLKTIPVKSAAHLEKLAVAAFNAGEGNVAAAQQRAKALGKDPTSFDAIEPYLPASTRTYVARVTGLRQRFEDDDEGNELA